MTLGEIPVLEALQVDGKSRVRSIKRVDDDTVSLDHGGAAAHAFPFGHTGAGRRRRAWQTADRTRASPWRSASVTTPIGIDTQASISGSGGPPRTCTERPSRTSSE